MTNTFIGPIDLDAVELSSFEPIPEGIYTVVLSETEVKDTKNGKGKFIYLKANVIDGPHANRFVDDRLNVVNDNPTAQKIGQESLKRICMAIGLKEFTGHTTELENKPLKVKVTVKPAEEYIDNYGVVKPGSPKNEIKGYYGLDYNATAASVPPVPKAKEAVVQAEAKAEVSENPFA